MWSVEYSCSFPTVAAPLTNSFCLVFSKLLSLDYENWTVLPVSLQLLILTNLKIQVNASEIGAGAVFRKWDKWYRIEHPVCFFSPKSLGKLFRCWEGDMEALRGSVLEAFIMLDSVMMAGSYSSFLLEGTHWFCFGFWSENLQFHGTQHPHSLQITDVKHYSLLRLSCL